MKLLTTRNIVIALLIIGAIVWYKKSQAKKNETAAITTGTGKK